MSMRSMVSGNRPLPRQDELRQEFVHDAYKAKGKLSEPTTCPQCHAIFHKGRWQWGQVPAGTHYAVCPACRRLHDHYPAGFLTLQGEFFAVHYEQVVSLIHNFERQQQAEHPLRRIMNMEEKKDGGLLVTTTDIQLARSLGEALHRAYQGQLKFHYNQQENLLRVSWTH